MYETYVARSYLTLQTLQRALGVCFINLNAHNEPDHTHISHSHNCPRLVIGGDREQSLTHNHNGFCYTISRTADSFVAE